MKRIVRLTESDLRRIVKESVNEISRIKVANASVDWGNLYNDIANDFNRFYSTLHFYLQSNRGNRHMEEMMKYAKAIGEILNKKTKQATDLYDAASEKSFEDWAAENPNYTDDNEYWEDQI